MNNARSDLYHHGTIRLRQDDGHWCARYRHLLCRQYPRHLIPPLIESLNDSEHSGPLGIGLDLRTPDYLEKLTDIIQEIKTKVFHSSSYFSRRPSQHSFNVIQKYDALTR